MNKLWIVAKNVFFKNIKSGAFIWMVLGPFIFLAIGGGVGYYISQDMEGSEDATIAVVTSDDQIKRLIEPIDKPIIVFDSDIAQARKQLKEKEINGYLDLTDSKQPIFYQKTTDELVNISRIEMLLNEFQLNEIAEQLNISADEVNQIKATQVSVITERINFDRKEDNEENKDMSRLVNMGIAYILSFLLLIFISTFSSVIAQEIASEKGTRIMEVILSSMRASSNLLGKMLGILMTLGIQILIYIVVLFGAFFIPPVNDLIHRFIPNEVLQQLFGQGLLVSVLFLVFGVLMYVSLASFFGALVSRAEDAAKAITPVSMLAVIGFYIGMYSMSNPNSVVVIVASYVPLLSPFLIPFRMATETISTAFVWLSLFGTIVMAGLITWLSVWFYETSVLVYSEGNIFKAFKQSLSLRKNNKQQGSDRK